MSRHELQQLRGKQYLEDAITYAKSRGGQVLTASILRKKDAILWECNKGHQWTQAMGVVVGNKSWCKDCAGQTPRTLDELNTIAVSRGGKLLSTKYSNVDATYDFECSLGHTFSNSFKHVVGRGQWCPTCNKGSKSEEICRTTFEQIFEKPFKKVRPKWLRNSRNRQMELDGYNDELKIAFEYQGIQHFSKAIFGTNLKLRIEDDERKVELCREYGVFLVLIDYKMEYSQFPMEIKKQIKEFGLPTRNWDFEKEIDLSKAYIRDDRLLELIALLKRKNIKVLSTKWIAVDTKYEFECEVCGHIWTARGSHFFNSRRVGGCKKCAMKEIQGANRLDIKELQEYAAKFGGICLSESYGEIKQKYKFKCKFGHEFEGIYNNMKFRKTFCDICEGRQKKKFYSDSEALELFSKFNLQPIEPRPKLISKGWQSKCLICGETVSPSIQDLASRGVPCAYCSGFKISEKKVRAVFDKADLEPLVPFKSSSTPWKSECKICKTVVNGRYSNLLKGQGGCRTCYLKKQNYK
jgi:hypothetical protein